MNAYTNNDRKRMFASLFDIKSKLNNEERLTLVYLANKSNKNEFQIKQDNCLEIEKLFNKYFKNDKQYKSNIIKHNVDEAIVVIDPRIENNILKDIIRDLNQELDQLKDNK